MQRHSFASLRQGGRTKFVGAVVAQNQMLNQHGERSGKIRDGSNLFTNHRSANADVAQQAPLRGVVDAAAVAELINFPDVVQHDAGQKQVRVELGIVRRNRATQTDEAHDVFQQAADERVVHGHGRGSALQLGHDRGVFDHANKQTLEPGIFHGGNGSAQLGVKLLDIVLGVRQEVGEFVITLDRRDDLFERQFLLAVEKLYAAAHVHYIVAFESDGDHRKVVPHFRGDSAGAVHEVKLEPGLSGAR